VLNNNHTAVWGSWWHDGAWGYACCRSCVKASYCTGSAGEKAAAESAAQMVANIEARARADAEAKKRDDARRAASTLDNSHLEAKSWGEEAKAELEVRRLWGGRGLGRGSGPGAGFAARGGRAPAESAVAAPAPGLSGRLGALVCPSHLRGRLVRSPSCLGPCLTFPRLPPSLQLDKEKLAAALERQRRAAAASIETDERKRKFNSLAAEAEADVTEEDMEAFRMVKPRGEDPMAAARAAKGAAAGGYELLD
jgi:hypothetical protein